MAISQTIRSKRQALRFPGYSTSLHYRTDYGEGKAIILNISATGCAITAPSTQLEIGDKALLFFITLLEGEEEIQIQAKVIRKEANHLALQFFHMNEKEKQRFICFLAEHNRRKVAQAASKG